MLVKVPINQGKIISSTGSGRICFKDATRQGKVLIPTKKAAYVKSGKTFRTTVYGLMVKNILCLTTMSLTKTYCLRGIKTILQISVVLYLKV